MGLTSHARQHPMLAIHLDMTGKLALVVGGGAVGRRKALALLEAGARVRLVALEPCPAEMAPPALVWLQEPFRPEHLEGVSLVISAANPQVDAEVATLAQARGIWVNAASCPDAGDVTFPATIQRGKLVVTVSTQGAAPALAVQLRDRIASTLPDHLALWIDLLEEMRVLAQEQIADPPLRQALARELAALDGPDLLATQGIDAVREMLQEMLAKQVAGRYNIES